MSGCTVASLSHCSSGLSQNRESASASETDKASGCETEQLLFRVNGPLFVVFMSVFVNSNCLSSKLFIFNESLKNGAQTTVGFILILFTVERTGNQAELHLLKVIANTKYLRMEEKEKKKEKLEVCVQNFENEKAISALYYL